MKRIEVPATTKGEAATVHLYDNGTVFLEDGTFLGAVSKGSYSYSPTAAGHGGRIVRYHTQVDEWQATLPGSFGNTDYRGGTYPSHYRKNTRKAALAYLLAVHAGENASEAGYFYWEPMRG
jgi:hypothetical protein